MPVLMLNPPRRKRRRKKKGKRTYKRDRATYRFGKTGRKYPGLTQWQTAQRISAMENPGLTRAGRYRDARKIMKNIPSPPAVEAVAKRKRTKKSIKGYPKASKKYQRYLKGHKGVTVSKTFAKQMGWDGSWKYDGKDYKGSPFMWPYADWSKLSVAERKALYAAARGYRPKRKRKAKPKNGKPKPKTKKGKAAVTRRKERGAVAGRRRPTRIREAEPGTMQLLTPRQVRSINELQTSEKKFAFLARRLREKVPSEVAEGIIAGAGGDYGKLKSTIRSSGLGLVHVNPPLTWQEWAVYGGEGAIAGAAVHFVSGHEWVKKQSGKLAYWVNDMLRKNVTQRANVLHVVDEMVPVATTWGSVAALSYGVGKALDYFSPGLAPRHTFALQVGAGIVGVLKTVQAIGCIRKKWGTPYVAPVGMDDYLTLPRRNNMGDYLTLPRQNNNMGDYLTLPRRNSMGDYLTLPDKNSMGDYLTLPDKKNQGMGDYLTLPRRGASLGSYYGGYMQQFDEELLRNARRYKYAPWMPRGYYGRR